MEDASDLFYFSFMVYYLLLYDLSTSLKLSKKGKINYSLHFK